MVKMFASKAAGSEQPEAYTVSTLRVTSANGAKSAKSVSPKAENAAGGLFHHSLPGTSASAPNKMAQELAALKQPSPKKSIRCCGSAPPNAGDD